ncbi:ganglioside GM2 activator-like [Saccostrea echinata]|uniref:ganglioside GM2 activator-like n=1 Tax=Saccostrea echinata TaxID=191078 RepID=UPI002A818853|nr:ganglioside GM2 activator-like [Saccostrea echinata]
MYARLFVVVFLSVWQVDAEYHTFQWQSCTTDTVHQALKVHSVAVNPTPVLTPGPLHISFTASVLKQIEAGAAIQFDITRHTALGADVHIPCVGDLGSCILDGCSVIDNMLNGTRQGQRDLGLQIKKMFESVGVFTHCPIAVQNITISNYKIDIAELDPALNFIADGDYTIKATVLHPSTGIQLGCFQFNITLKRKSTGGGWLLGRKRRSYKNAQ